MPIDGQADDAGIEHVGRIEAPAQAGLDHHDVKAGAGEQQERGGGQGLELRRRLATGALRRRRRGGHARERIVERLCRDRGSVDLDPLVPAVYVG